MNIQRVQSNYQTPNFRGTLFTYTQGALNTNELKGLATEIGFMDKSAKVADGVVAVVDEHAPYALDALKRLGLTPMQFKVPDMDVRNYPIIDLLRMHQSN